MPALPAEVACPQVLQRLFQSIDMRDFETAIAQFAADAVWARQGSTLTSHDAMRAAFRGRSATLHTMHVLSGMMVTVQSPGRATARGYMSVYRRDGGQAPALPMVLGEPEMLVVTDAEFRLEGDTWRVTRLANTPQYAAASKG